MFPSILAQDIRTGLKNFLISGFEASDAFFSGVVRRFSEHEERWIKGPWLQIGLPFRNGIKGRNYFQNFQIEFDGFVHQEAAWERICIDKKAANTLVATGTGSGKTECFVYPLLDHCSQELKRGEKGIKALVIYPMNALANDQAQRFAKLIFSTPHFKNLRVGLFVGGGHGAAGKGVMMTQNSVINDRDTMRKHPPDVLLTNYKMLDYLLIRPIDQKIWKLNSPTTLRYIVVDELHTFDGAQGTDLAMLLRRLKSRLKTPKDHLINVGTSATMGDDSDTQPLRDYAKQVFGSEFDSNSVITEKRLSVNEFLQDMPVEHVFQHSEGLEKSLDPLNYSEPGEAVRTWFSIFFPAAKIPTLEDVNDLRWRCELGKELKKHLLFQNLLRQLKLRNELIDLPTLVELFHNTLPLESRPYASSILDALHALVAWARVPSDPKEVNVMPMVTLRIQLWLRELRRMVAGLTNVPEEVEILPEIELGSNRDHLYLPMIQCSECHTTCWLSRLHASQNNVSIELDSIYSAWFSNNSECVRLYPSIGIKNPIGESNSRGICGNCGLLQAHENQKCSDCGSEKLINVWEVSETRQTIRNNVPSVWHMHRCPSCGVHDRLILMGARSTTLGANVVEQMWNSPFNDDKKLITFSDSVQDAAHRSGFFGSRTYRSNIHRAVFQAAQHLKEEEPSLMTFLNRLQAMHNEDGSPLEMSKEHFVSEFIGPDMQWQDDWERLKITGSLSSSSPLVNWVEKRLGWQAFAEVSYLNRFGRSLESLGLLVVAPEINTVNVIVESLKEPLKEELGLDNKQEVLFQWIWGFLDHLRQRGAIAHPAMDSYAQRGDFFALLNAKQHRLWLPRMGLHSFHPVFLSTGRYKYFDHISRGQGKTWYETWLEKNFVFTADGIAEAAYEMAIKKLVEHKLLKSISGEQGEVLALNPDNLKINLDTIQIFSEQGQYWLTVPGAAGELLLEMPCLDGDEKYKKIKSNSVSAAQRLSRADLGRVFATEHTGLLERETREDIEKRFKDQERKPWYENLLSATPTLEMGVDIGDLSSIMLCSVPPNQASYLQRIGRAGRRDGNAFTVTLSGANSPHDLYFYESTEEMIRGVVSPPGIFLKAAEVLKRQLFAFCLDNWVVQDLPENVFPEKTKGALDAVENNNGKKFPKMFQDYVLQNEQELLDGFLDLLRPDLDQSVELRLTNFIRAENEDDHLRIKLHKTLEEIVDERKRYKERAREIKKQINKLNKLPPDDHIRKEVDELTLERQKLLEMVRENENQDLLNTLTDAGLIPNYAFPETGITLKSVIWRRRQDQGTIDTPTYKYERPAASAISEFAPNNRFYANQRRVEVDQINMELAKAVSWRLCSECHYLQPIDVLNPDEKLNCPKCHSAQWNDSAQKQTLLSFSQVIATTEDAASRIDDSADERDPKFYVRQMLVNFEREAVREAWKLKNEDLPFGFEFISKADFSDINFGEVNRPGPEISIAGSSRVRPGFRICKQCGKVQNSYFNQDDINAKTSWEHAIDCTYRDSNDNSFILNVHLYRHFSSEAMRILVPYTKSGVDDLVTQSFIAAIQLGFKLKFGGRVDHLRFSEQNTPDLIADGRRHYILIHDSVPGGTGYLHQLLSGTAETMLDLLKKAYNHIIDCPCKEEPDKDGCYRCVYQYRLSRQMDNVSRSSALEVLKELLENDVEWEKVETISDIQINAHLDSALEQMFLNSLKKLARKNGLPSIRMIQEIINGKTGYIIEIEDQCYNMEPQKLLGENEGVSIKSKPDFVISPVSPKPNQRKVAVFCDGWEFHKDITDQDARKRSAIVHSGRYWVWSVSYQDVEKAMSGETKTDLQTPFISHKRDGAPGPAAPNTSEAFNSNSVYTLLNWLWQSGKDYDVELKNMQKIASNASLKMACTPRENDYEQNKKSLKERWQNLPEWVSVPEESLPSFSPDGISPEVSYWWPKEFTQENFDVNSSGMVLLNDSLDKAELHKEWRTWLWFYNHFQMLPGMLMTTKKGLESNDLNQITINGEESIILDSDIWEETIEDAVNELKDGMRKLASYGIEKPDEVGAEIADDQGRVFAEAELLWNKPRVALLRSDQSDFRKTLEEQKWTVVLAENDWPNTLRSILNKTI